MSWKFPQYSYDVYYEEQSEEQIRPGVRSSQGVRVSGLQIPGLPQPGKTTQGLSGRRRSSEIKKSFGTVRNFWRQLEGGGPEPKRVRRQFGKKPSEEPPPRKSLRKPVLRRLAPSRHASKRMPTINEESKLSMKNETHEVESEEQLQVTTRLPSRQSHRTPDEIPLIDIRPPSEGEGEGGESETTENINDRDEEPLPETGAAEEKISSGRKLSIEERGSKALLSGNIMPTQQVRSSGGWENLSVKDAENRLRHSTDQGTIGTPEAMQERRGSKQSREWRDSMFGGLMMAGDDESGSEEEDLDENERPGAGYIEEGVSPRETQGIGRLSKRATGMGRTSGMDSALLGRVHRTTGDAAGLETTPALQRGRLTVIPEASRRSSARLSLQGGFIPPPAPPPPPPPLPPPTFLKPPSFWHTPKLGLATRRPSIVLPILLEDEKHFHELVASGDVMAVQDFLERRPNFNINCTNYQGISGLLIAVKAGNEEMVQFLIAQPSLEIGDTHLYAIRDDQPLILRMILDTLQSVNPSLEFMACAHSTEFAENITPLILAAQCGNYEIIGILLDRGHTIPVPHPPRCFCKEECQVLMLTEDPLSVASGKLHIYRALCNPAYICRTSDDPILTAFRLSKELLTCGHVEQSYIRQYEDLAEATRLFAVDLIAECRSSEEVQIIISEAKGTDLKGLYTYPRLILAMDLKQKEFVAHPNIQQVLEKTWYGDWVNWKGYRKVTKALYFIPRILMLPGILVLLMFMPTSAWAKFYALPINKLLSNVASYSIFLILVFVQSNVDKTNQTRDTKPTGVEVFLAIYVIAFLYDSIRSLIIEGPRRFFGFMWNVYEVTMEILFILTFVFWITAAIKTTVTGTKDVERKYWHYMDSELIAEGLFVLASIMAYMRILLICQMSYDLGPLQVSLGKMTNDCAIFSVILGIIILAFTVGLCKFYNYYEGMQQKNPDTGEVDEKQANSFTSFLETFKTLFWGLFGMSSFEVADVVIENLNDEKGEANVLNEHHFTEAIGYIVFAVYMTLTVIVILNMLIATMSNTFQKVTDNVDTEWAFGRTEVKLAYMNKPVMPPPFNIIPTTRGLVDLFKGAKDKAARITGLVDVEKGLMEEEKKVEEFSVMMSQLVQRYFSTKSNDIT